MTTPAIHGTKVCSHCGEEKRVLAFAAHPTTHDRLQPWCRECNGKYQHQRYISRARRPNSFRMPERP